MENWTADPGKSSRGPIILTIQEKPNGQRLIPIDPHRNQAWAYLQTTPVGHQVAFTKMTFKQWPLNSDLVRLFGSHVPLLDQWPQTRRWDEEGDGEGEAGMLLQAGWCMEACRCTGVYYSERYRGDTRGWLGAPGERP